MRAPRCAWDRALSTPRRRARACLAAGLAALVVATAFLGDGSPETVLLSAAEAAQPVSALTGHSAAASVTRASDRPQLDLAEPRAAHAPATGTPAPRSIDAVALSPRLAQVDGLTVRLPTSAPLAVGFHEAATSSALEMTPVGRLVANRNTTRVTPPRDAGYGTDYLIMSSRERVQPATSAVDVVMTDDEPVLAPVTGTVSDVRDYLLYGTRDRRVEIVPDAAPHLRVVLIHVTDVEVAVGDRVIAGRSTVAGGPNRFSFSSQIDRETEPDRWPHVHLEVQPNDAPRPGDG